MVEFQGKKVLEIPQTCLYSVAEGRNPLRIKVAEKKSVNTPQADTKIGAPEESTVGAGEQPRQPFCRQSGMLCVPLIAAVRSVVSCPPRPPPAQASFRGIQQVPGLQLEAVPEMPSNLGVVPCPP